MWPLGSERIGADFVDVLPTRLARKDRRLNRLDLVEVDHTLLSVAADAVHRTFATVFVVGSWS
jgi:hypothetical protein